VPLSEADLIVSPIGADTDLRAAMEDLKLGRYLAARDLLAVTGMNLELRTSRSLLLAAGAGKGGAFKTWVDEDPASADAAMMWARVLTRAAVAAHRKGRPGDLVGAAARMARSACERAAVLAPYCPVPWICLLHLTQLPYDPSYFDPYAMRRPRPWDRIDDITMPYAGPWPLLYEIDRRDPGNREGYQRMRQYFRECGPRGAAMNFSSWVATGTPRHPVLLMLPLYALMDDYMAVYGDGGSRMYWQTDQVRLAARRARDVWFAQVPPVQRAWLPLADLSHLAHALVACGEDAREVFEAMGPYVTAEPWQQINRSYGHSYDWKTEYCRTREAALRYGRSA
jgi:hypothetical protein